MVQVFRIVRAGRLLGRCAAHGTISYPTIAGSALFTLLFLIFLVLEFGGLAILTAERQSPDANIKSASDALWYTFVTITTVGYGDQYPVTPAGRLMGVAVMMAGVGLFERSPGF
jgi:voltage-gated potassium channel